LLCPASALAVEYRLSVDEAADAVTADGSGTIRLFYNLTPPVTVRVSATSWYRMIRK